MNLPESCVLWTRARLQGETPSVYVGVWVTDEAGSYTETLWEFLVEEHHLSGRALCVYLFDSAWPAFAQIPEFFEALSGEDAPRTLADVRAVLDRLGATDVTARTRPSSIPAPR